MPSVADFVHEVRLKGIKPLALTVVTQLHLLTIVKRFGKQISGGATSVLSMGTQVDSLI